MIINVGKNQIEVYESVQELPVLRFQKFNKYLLFADEVGNTLTDARNRVIKSMQFIKSDLKDEAINELENLNMTFFNADQEKTLDGRAFAVLVKRINSNYFQNYTTDHLDDCLEQLEKIGFTVGQMNEALETVKKKSTLN